MRKNWWTSPSLWLGHIFKVMKEFYVHVYQYNIAIMWPKYKYIGGVIQVSRLVLWEKCVWFFYQG